jgi:hypothetical protein
MISFLSITISKFLTSLITRVSVPKNMLRQKVVLRDESD